MGASEWGGYQQFFVRAVFESAVATKSAAETRASAVKERRDCSCGTNMRWEYFVETGLI